MVLYCMVMHVIYHGMVMPVHTRHSIWIQCALNPDWERPHLILFELMRVETGLSQSGSGSGLNRIPHGLNN